MQSWSTEVTLSVYYGVGYDLSIICVALVDLNYHLLSSLLRGPKQLDPNTKKFILFNDLRRRGQSEQYSLWGRELLGREQQQLVKVTVGQEQRIQLDEFDLELESLNEV
jgi:hypothetical protein